MPARHNYFQNDLHAVQRRQALKSFRLEFRALVELRQRPDAVLLAQLGKCTVIMPPPLCRDLGMPIGSTYAQAVRRLRAPGFETTLTARRGRPA